MEWYYAEGGTPVGPISEDDFAKLAGEGKITAETLVWCQGMANWAKYGSLAAGTSAPGQAAVEPAAGLQTCCECGKAFPPDEMVRHGGNYICAQCKPVFYQRLQEGALASQGNTPNKELMAQARASLSGSWGLSIGVVVVAWLISFAATMAASLVPVVGGCIGNIISLFIEGPFAVGLATVFLAIGRTDETDFAMLFAGFRRYWPSVLANLLKGIFVGLWAMIFLVPAGLFFAAMIATKAAEQHPMYWIWGILLLPLLLPAYIAAFSYSMTFFVIAEDPTAGPYEAIVRSIHMMRGCKWKLFCLYLRFIGWILLCIPTCFIGFLWLVPYMSTATARFYDDVKGRAAAQA